MNNTKFYIKNIVRNSVLGICGDALTGSIMLEAYLKTLEDNGMVVDKAHYAIRKSGHNGYV